MIRSFAVPLLVFAAACAASRPRPYSERCQDPSRPCTLSYDFEPSGAARDVFSSSPEHFLVLNEDGLLFSWTLDEKSAWDHDNVSFVRALGDSVTKLESAASAVCDGTPVFLAAANFAPGRKGPSPQRQRVVAITGAIDAPVRILEQTSALISGLTAKYGAEAVKVEGLALSADCRSLFIGLRSWLGPHNSEHFLTDVYRLDLDVDWKGTRERASLAETLSLRPGVTCSGQAEGISSLELLRDGSMLVLTSYEKETRPRTRPEEIGEAELAGSLWKRSPEGALSRVACFKGNKPEALVVNADESAARIIFENDDYGGRPIGSLATKVALPK